MFRNIGLVRFLFPFLQTTRFNLLSLNFVRTRLLSGMSLKRTATIRESQEFDASFSQGTDFGEGASQESRTRKRPRKEDSQSSIAEYTGPTNKVLPVHIQFPPKPPGTTRLASWNVSGLVACEKKVRFQNSLIAISVLNSPFRDSSIMLQLRILTF